MLKLFVGGFPLEITEMQLAQLIAPHGNISTIKIVRDRQTKKCKGYAFVEMATEQDAAQVAAALDGEMMEGRELSVKIAEDRPAPSGPPKPNFKRPMNNTGYVKRDRPDFDAPRSKRPRRPLS